MFVMTATARGTRNDVAPPRTTARIISVMAAVTNEMIRSPRHTGSDQNESSFTRTPSNSSHWIVPILICRSSESLGIRTLKGSARNFEDANLTSDRFTREPPQ